MTSLCSFQSFCSVTCNHIPSFDVYHGSRGSEDCACAGTRYESDFSAHSRKLAIDAPAKQRFFTRHYEDLLYVLFLDIRELRCCSSNLPCRCVYNYRFPRIEGGNFGRGDADLFLFTGFRDLRGGNFGRGGIFLAGGRSRYSASAL